ncbi:hypothetical protein [Chroococcidiopsis sp. SAG 2025]|uniref:hypothetical protein n=1 Tax=Chroococcidiopsis sp. SAG 2025 TaxID=171389 RepID=UPI00293727AE|nr:hypothetical protein [Chroococcidiopsis sp. SAG 2025]
MLARVLAKVSEAIALFLSTAILDRIYNTGRGAQLCAPTVCVFHPIVSCLGIT